MLQTSPGCECCNCRQIGSASRRKFGPLLIQLLLPVEFSGLSGALFRIEDVGRPWSKPVGVRGIGFCQVEVQQALLLQRLEECKALESQVEAVRGTGGLGLGLS